MMMNVCKPIMAVQPIASSPWKRVRAAIAMDVPRQMMATYISSTHEPNSIPNCSQMTEKMKSVW